MNTYQGYLLSNYSLTFEEMESIYVQMIMNVSLDPDAIELYQDILENAISYVEYRAKWAIWDREKKLNNDEARTSCHDALIIKLNIFARYMKSQGHSTDWRDILGDEMANPYVRKRIGDFACYMVFVNALGER